MSTNKSQIEKWITAQKKHRLSDVHVQMARELGLNPDKFGKIDNHRQFHCPNSSRKFISNVSKKEHPDTVKPLKQILKELEMKKEAKKKAKEERRKPEKGNAPEKDSMSAIENGM